MFSNQSAARTALTLVCVTWALSCGGASSAPAVNGSSGAGGTNTNAGQGGQGNEDDLAGKGGSTGQASSGGAGGSGGAEQAGQAGSGGAGGAGSGGAGQAGASGKPFRPPVPLPEPPKLGDEIGLLTFTTVTAKGKENCAADMTDFEICLTETDCFHVLRSDREKLKKPQNCSEDAQGGAGGSSGGSTDEEEDASGAYRDRAPGEENVYYIEIDKAKPLLRSSLDRMVIRPLGEAKPNQTDSWRPSCLAISADGSPVYCGAIDKALTETSTPFEDKLQLGCQACFQGGLLPPGPSPKGVISHGPMQGPPTPDSVTLWMRTDATRLVTVSMATAADFSDATRVAAAYPDPKKDFTVSLTVGDLSPGKTYYYRVEVDEKPATEIAPIRTAPAPDGDSNYRFVFGSCARRGTAQGFIPDRPPLSDGEKKFQTFDRLLRLTENPLDLVVYTGDIHYGKTTEVGKLRWNYRVTRRDRFALHNGVPTIGVWDDHDFGPNDSDKGKPENDDPYSRKNSAQVFREYFANPFAQSGGAIYFRHRHGDVEFFGIDTRYFRSDMTQPLPDPNPPQILGDKQFSWLLDALGSSDASFKIIVGGSTFSPNPSSDKSWGPFPAERDALLTELHKRKISGVILTSGGPHHSEIRTIKRKNGYSIPELVASPLSSGSSACPDDPSTDYKLERCTGKIAGKYIDENGEQTGTINVHSVILTQVIGAGEGRKLRVRLVAEYAPKPAPSTKLIAGTIIDSMTDEKATTILGEPYDIPLNSLQD